MAPHFPQLPGSLCRSAHWPLQFVSPETQEAWQTPAAQTWPLGQALLQVPQCCGLDWGSTQVLPHFAVVPEQLAAH